MERALLVGSWVHLTTTAHSSHALAEGLGHLEQDRVHHAEARHGRRASVTLRVLVRAVGAGAGLSELALDLRMNEQTLVAIGALREVLAIFSRVDELTRSVLFMALGPERTLDLGGALDSSHLVLTFRHIRAVALLLEEIGCSLLLPLAALRTHRWLRCGFHKAESLLTLLDQSLLFSLGEISVGLDLFFHVVELLRPLHACLFGRPRTGRYYEMILVAILIVLSVPEFVIRLILVILVVIVVFLESLLLWFVEVLLEVFLEWL